MITPAISETYQINLLLVQWAEVEEDNVPDLRILVAKIPQKKEFLRINIGDSIEDGGTIVGGGIGDSLA
ncbi:hypothetical protein Tco_1073268 [Tanacetum coccineum]